MRRPVTVLISLAALATAAVGLPAPASAGQSAVGPVTVHKDATEEPVGDGDLVVDGQGKAYAVFTMDKIAGDNRIILATRSAGGAWSTRELASGRVSMPDVAVNADGDVVAVWATFNFGSPNWSEVWCAAFPAGDPVGVVGPVTMTDHLVYNPQVVVDPQRRATVAWVDDQKDPDTGDYTFAPDLRAVTSPVVDPDPETDGDSICEHHGGTVVTTAGSGYLPSVYVPWLGVDGQGNVSLAWQEQDDVGIPHTRAIGTARQPAGTGTWSTHELVRVDQPDTAGIVDLAVGDAGASASGDVALAWLDADASGTTAAAATRPGSGPGAGTWSSLPLDASTQAREIALAPTPAGGTLAAFSTGPPSSQTLAVRTRAAGSGTWSAPDVLASTGKNGQPTVAVDAAGGATVVWLGGSTGLTSRHRPAAAGSWDPAVAVPVRLGADYPQAVAAPTGEVVVVWPDFSAGEISGARLGTAPPPPPPTATVGALAAYQRSGAVPVSWSGSGGSGTRSYDVRYRRAAPGGGFGAPVTWRTATAATTGVLSTTPGTVCLSARATAGGATGAWSSERCTSVPLDDRALVATAGWTAKKGTGYIAGTYRQATLTGRSLRTATVKARTIALVVGKGRGYGSLAVYLGATKLAVVPLASTTLRKGVVVPVKTFASVRTGVLRVVVASSGRPVVVDAVHVRQ